MTIYTRARRSSITSLNGPALDVSEGVRHVSFHSDCANIVGDLDPQVSKYTLVPLKVAYKKLRLLVDLGCIFLGHGLAKDFRTIS